VCADKTESGGEMLIHTVQNAGRKDRQKSIELPCVRESQQSRRVQCPRT